MVMWRFKPAQAFASPTATAGLWERAVRPCDPERPDPTWHISPAIDMAAYHFSWAWILLPLLFAGPDPYTDYPYLFALMMGLTFAHRHYGMPYAYLDAAVFQTYRKRLIRFPILCLGLFAATPLLLDRHVAGPIGPAVVGILIFLSLLWNLWHTPMQKYGMLRLYMAKSPAPRDRKTPAWIDRCFIFCWFPLYFSYLGPRYKDLILSHGGAIEAYLAPILRVMETYKAWLQIPSGLAAATVVVIWTGYECRCRG
jgi:hypothetical protein